MTTRRERPAAADRELSLESRAARIVRDLDDLARDVFLARPYSRDVVRSLPGLGLELKVDFGARDGRAPSEGRRLLDLLVEHVDDAILTHAAFRPGRVYCFFCERADCEHAAPGEPRQVFDGYGETGMPEWRTLLEQAIARGLEQMDVLARERGPAVTVASPRSILVSNRLDVFARTDRVYDLRGQIALGYYREGDAALGAKFAVTLQVVRSSTRSGVHRLGLNLIGRLPSGDEASALLGRGGDYGFVDLIRVAQGELARINQDLRRAPVRARAARAAEEADRLLHEMAQGSIRHVRREAWRTDHAKDRAAERTRPTGMARGDLERARAERAFFDVLKQTFVVLGGRGRAHVFNAAGLHVTSLHLDAKEIDGRREKGRWRALNDAEFVALAKAARDAFASAARTAPTANGRDPSQPNGSHGTGDLPP